MTRFRLPIASAFSLAATTAFAHPGHVEHVAGHSHWLGWGAAAAALLIVAGGLVLGYRAISKRGR